jgi:hypothetical protein
MVLVLRSGPMEQSIMAYTLVGIRMARANSSFQMVAYMRECLLKILSLVLGNTYGQTGKFMKVIGRTTE